MARAIVLAVAVLLAVLPVIPSTVSAQQAGGPPGATAPASPLDYDVFKTKVLPILTSPRAGNARCIACHSRGGGDAYLEPFAPGATTYSEEQARRIFTRVSRLVAPGDPMKSILLTNPLDEEAGGSHWHGGGKHWHSQNDAEWQTLASWVRTRSTPPPAPSGLNYDVFKTKVLPILTSSRKGNARCIACHSRGGGDAYLEPFAPGSTTYNEEQARRIFTRVSRLVVFGDPMKSILLTNPLDEEVGGSHWHGGGKHWHSQNDPEWQILAAWVRGS